MESFEGRENYTLEIEKCTNRFSTTVSSNFWITTTWPCVIQALKSRETRRRKYVWLDRLTMDDGWWQDGGPQQSLAIEIVRSSGRFSSTYTLIYGLDRRNERAKLVHTSKWSYIRDITLYTYQHTVCYLWTICNVFVFPLYILMPRHVNHTIEELNWFF